MTPEQLAELFVEDTGDNIAGIATDIEILLKQAYKSGYKCAVLNAAPYDAFLDGYQYAIDKVCEWLEQHAYLYVDDIDQLHESALIGDFRKCMED